MIDHHDPIISIYACYELDLYASATKHTCVLRVMSTNYYFRTIIPDLQSKLRYKIFRVVLSLRGYAIFQLRSAFSSYGKDALVIYSIHGERIVSKELDESINTFILDRFQYFIVNSIYK